MLLLWERITLFFWFVAWFVIGMIGAFLFILIQLVLLVDMAHSWNESWVNRMEEGNSRRWYAGRCLNPPVRAVLHYSVLHRECREKLHWLKCINFEGWADFLNWFPIEFIVKYMHFWKGVAQILCHWIFPVHLFWDLWCNYMCSDVEKSCI